MKLTWLNDLHLEFLGTQNRQAFVDRLAKSAGDAVLIAGDTAVAETIVDTLAAIASAVACPVYFVLGNHDFYHGSIEGVRAEVRNLCGSTERLHWLSETGAIRLSDTVSLVGHDGWGDGRLGDPAGSPVLLNDFALIRELAGLPRPELLSRLRALGDEAAAHISRVLDQAMPGAEHIIVLTHVPPFAGAAWHQGQPSDKDYVPFFACKAVGDVLLATMESNPDKSMTVLCGHTHGGGTYEPLPNIKVITGAARYGHPTIHRPLRFV